MDVQTPSPRTGELTRVDFQQRLLRSLPASVRADAERNFAEFNAMTPQQRDAKRRADDEAYARRLSEGLDFRRRENCGLSLKQWTNTFKRFRPGSYEQGQAKEAAQAFVRDWPNVDGGLMFWGPSGRGKDHLLHSIIIALLDRTDVRPDIRYWYALDIEDAMLQEWSRGADKDREHTRIEEVMRGCDLLLIGDLHKLLSAKSEQVVRAAWRVINQAETTGAPVLCATGKYNVSKYDELASEDIGSRLSACCRWYHVDSPEDARRAGR